MAKKFEYRPDQGADEEVKRQTKNGHGPCEVFGCIRMGHIHTTNWNCRYHHGRKGESLSNITMLIKNHEREINWYEKVLNMAYHEFKIMAGNAPANMLPIASEELPAYKLRMSLHITQLLADPDRLPKPSIKYTYADYAEGEL